MIISIFGAALALEVEIWYRRIRRQIKPKMSFRFPFTTSSLPTKRIFFFFKKKQLVDLFHATLLLITINARNKKKIVKIFQHLPEIYDVHPYFEVITFQHVFLCNSRAHIWILYLFTLKVKMKKKMKKKCIFVICCSFIFGKKKKTANMDKCTCK